MSIARASSAVIVALGVLGAPAARAEIDPGPAFELDAPVRAEAWGDQWDPRVAAGPEGSLVMWVNRVILETSVTFRPSAT